MEVWKEAMISGFFLLFSLIKQHNYPFSPGILKECHWTCKWAHNQDKIYPVGSEEHTSFFGAFEDLRFVGHIRESQLNIIILFDNPSGKKTIYGY